MAQIARNQNQVVSQSGGRNLEIGVRKDCSGFFKMSADPAEYLGRVDIKGEDGNRWNDAFFYIVHVSVAGLGAIGAFIEFTDDHGAGELFFPRDVD